MLDRYILRKHDLEVDDIVQFFVASTEEAFRDDASYVLKPRSCSMITLESLSGLVTIQSNSRHFRGKEIKAEFQRFSPEIRNQREVGEGLSDIVVGICWPSSLRIPPAERAVAGTRMSLQLNAYLLAFFV